MSVFSPSVSRRWLFHHTAGNFHGEGMHAPEYCGLLWELPLVGASFKTLLICHCVLCPPLPWSRSQTFDTSESPVSSTQRAAAWNRHNTCDYWVTPVCESMTQAWTGPTGARVGTSVPGCFSHVSNWACILWLISSSRFNRNQGLWCLLYSCYFRETQVLSQQACLATLSTKGYCENVNEPPKCAWFLKKK